jgi:hypothetical protein
MTDMYYDMLLGHIGLYDEGKKLHGMKEKWLTSFTHTTADISQKQTVLRFWSLKMARSTNA